MPEARAKKRLEREHKDGNKASISRKHRGLNSQDAIKASQKKQAENRVQKLQIAREKLVAAGPECPPSKLRRVQERLQTAVAVLDGLRGA